ncbi:MAG: hypothetical protein II767_08615 [Proteobacteria bacterium]|nr:hypothetical protein [Pseudomonadota bacterium]MBQ4360304.1 hypothetical protein [Pseudomonadota bacterium]
MIRPYYSYLKHSIIAVNTQKSYKNSFVGMNACNQINHGDKFHGTGTEI